MMKLRWMLLPIFLFVGCSISRADTRVEVRSVISEQSATAPMRSVRKLVYYRHGPMRRKDSIIDLGGNVKASLSEIVNCDTRTGLFIDSNAREYQTYKVVTFWSEAQFADYLKKAPQRAVHIESRTVDTGERKEFFGYTAKHLVTTMKRAPDPNGGGGGEQITDGWYIEHEPLDEQCAPAFVRSAPFYLLATGLAMYPDVPQFQHVGPLPTGLAVEVTNTIKLAGVKGGSSRTITMERTVESISDSPLNPSIFALPAGMRENRQLLKGRLALPNR